MTSGSVYGHAAAILTVLIWGTTFISTKVLLAEFQPVELLFFRFVLGYLALWAACPRRLKLTRRRQELYFAAAGLCGVTLYFLLENIALTYTQASNVGVLVAVSPIGTALLAQRFLDGERLRPTFFAGLATAMAGVILLAYNGAAVLKLNPLGDLLALLAALAWSFYSILTRRMAAFGYGTIQSTRRIFFYGLLFMLPALPLSHARLGLERLAQPVYLLNLLYLGLGASALCFVTWGIAMGRLGAVKTSVYIYLVPVVTMAASAFFLREQITPLSLGGMGLTLAGLAISQFRPAGQLARRSG